MSASVASSFPVPLMVCVSGAGNVWSVSKTVPTQVSSGQTVSHGPLVCQAAPPLGLVSAMQVEAISQTVMAQMLGMFETFQAQISALPHCCHRLVLQ